MLWKWVMCMFGGSVKMCEFYGYAFWNLKVYKQKNVSGQWFFMHIISFKNIFSMKRGYFYVLETCKNVWILRVCFFKCKSIQAKKMGKMSKNRLFRTTETTKILPLTQEILHRTEIWEIWNKFGGSGSLHFLLGKAYYFYFISHGIFFLHKKYMRKFSHCLYFPR